jgi:hypothetical protein
MIHDLHAQLGYEKDATGKEVAVLAVEGETGGAGGVGKAVMERVTLLLDGKGKLVGVDLGGHDLGRVAVMLGRHEDVVSRRDADAEVERVGTEVTAVRVLVA